MLEMGRVSDCRKQALLFAGAIVLVDKFDGLWEQLFCRDGPISGPSGHTLGAHDGTLAICGLAGGILERERQAVRAVQFSRQPQGAQG